FRMDILKDVGEIEEAFSMLASNSKYFAFPGYPYALIDAHEYAKVGREEAMHIKGLILDSLNKEESKKMEEFEASLTGHRILDELG
ncbi:MAG: hypothetical protein N3D72_02735, partial [Candidatus Methanomethyliaceae archaeon]|nr:hypothetical protein [Candidatus Methanomethyliaceae archaeon]